jgi:hypothetical protein
MVRRMSDLMKQKVDMRTLAAVIGATMLLSAQMYGLHRQVEAAITVRQMSAWTEKLQEKNPELKVPSIADTVLRSENNAVAPTLADMERKNGRAN